MGWRDAEANKDVIEQAKMKLLSLNSGFQKQVGNGPDGKPFNCMKKGATDSRCMISDNICLASGF